MRAGDEHRHRVAGQADQRRTLDDAERDRAPGLMASRQNTSEPVAATAARTWSSSPVETRRTSPAGRAARRLRRSARRGRRGRPAGGRDRPPRRRAAPRGRPTACGWNRRSAPAPAARRARATRRRWRKSRPSGVGGPAARQRPARRPARGPAGAAVAPPGSRPTRATSSPALRRLAPARSPGGRLTRPSSWRVTSSCMNTMSAPCGTGAPVNTRMAEPGSAPSAAWPAATRPRTGRRVGAAGSRSAVQAA